MTRLIVATKARVDLSEIAQFTGRRWSTEQADRYVEALLRRFSWLTRNSGALRHRRDLPSNLKLYREGRHLIIARAQLSNNTLEIVRVLHESMDVRAQLAGD